MIDEDLISWYGSLQTLDSYHMPVVMHVEREEAADRKR